MIRFRKMMQMCAMPVRKSPSALALAAVLMAAPGVNAADYMDLQIERTARNIAAVQDYFGVLEQKGLYGTAALLSEVSFRRPHEFRVRVTAPAELAGTQVSYHGTDLLTWWPQQELALIIRGFVPPDAASEGQRVADAYKANLENYYYGLGPVRDVAGFPALQIDQRARSSNQLVQASVTQVYDNHSFPLAGQVTLRGGAKFDYRWQKIVFNSSDRALPPLPVLPASTMIAEWNLAWPARTAAEVAARVPKAAAFPDALGGLPRDRLIIHPDGLPAVAGWYRNNDYYLLASATRDTGWNPFANEYGLQVPLGGGTARLVISPLNSNWTIRHGGVVYTVLTNLHPELAYREIVRVFAPSSAVAGVAAPAARPASVKKQE
jgi:hypothetical protein